MALRKQRVLVIGGGFFGMYIADYFARRGADVSLYEKEPDFMQRASLVNQARVHNGYHYPRSVLTALRSRASFPRFCEEFADCIDDSFQSYYLVGKLLSKVTGIQFEKFCQRIGAYCEPAPHKITRLVNPNLVDAVFSTSEYAFDAVKLKQHMLARIGNAGVNYHLNQRVASVAKTDSAIEVTLAEEDNKGETLEVDQVFNCSYAMINHVLEASRLELIPLKHEMTEMCLVEVPPPLQEMALTVMCGPFFSSLPYPSRAGLHTFSHVRYTPHYQWYDEPGKSYREAHQHFDRVEKPSAWRAMIADAQRYLPLLSECRYRESIWEVKTVLPRSEVDDSRPILFKRDVGIPGFHCVMGGKIDNVYDAVNIIEQQGLCP